MNILFDHIGLSFFFLIKKSSSEYADKWVSFKMQNMAFPSASKCKMRQLVPGDILSNLAICIDLVL